MFKLESPNDIKAISEGMAQIAYVSSLLANGDMEGLREIATYSIASEIAGARFMNMLADSFAIKKPPTTAGDEPE